MRVKLALLAGALVFSAIRLPAQEAPDAAKEAEVRRLIEVMGIKKMMDNMMPQLMAQMGQQTDQMMQQQMKEANLPPERAETVKKMREFMSARIIEEFKGIDMEGTTARIYSKHFTIDEIRALVAFYESPIGRKMLEKTPQIMQESMTESMAHTQQMMVKLLKEMREKFPEVFSPPNP